MLSFETKGLSKCISQFDNIKKLLDTTAKRGLNNALNQTRTAAVTAKNKVIQYPDEILDSEIKVEFLGGGLKGRVYTDGERVLFVEFGTGTEAEMPHIGKTSTFLQSRYTLWLLPVEKAPMDYGSDRRITVGNSQFYMMFPTSPKAFFRTTAFLRRDLNVETVRKTIADMLGGVK